MMRWFAWLFVALLYACGGASGSSGSLQVKTTGAELESIAEHGTYMHATAERAPEGYPRGALRPAVIDKVRRGVDAELQAKGYRLAEDGELLVRISTGARMVEEDQTRLTAAAGTTPDIEKEGALVIDVFERATGTQLFHGYARDVIQNGDLTDDQLAQAVSKILDRLPSSAR